MPVRSRTDCWPGARAVVAVPRTVLRLALLSFALLACVQSRAQSPQGSISGVVTCYGQPVSGANVTIINESTNEERIATTDASGQFVMEGLRSGNYTIRVHAADYTDGLLRGVPLVAEESRRVDVFLMKPSRALAPSPPPPPAAPSGRVAEAPVARRSPPAEWAPTPLPRQKHATVRIFYATDRKRSNSRQPALFYGGARLEAEGNSPMLELGACEVSVPFSHQIGELESPVWWKLEFRPDPERHVVLMSVVPLDGNRFFSELRTRVSGSPGKEAFVFVHGYNTTFEDAARRTAQIAHDLRFSGAPVLYSWPSQGEVAKYTFDENNIEWTWKHLADFLQALSRQSGASTIHLIAHSMGNRALTKALEVMPKSPSPLFREVVLAAPDIDAGVFKQMAAAIKGKAERITLYASSKDKALLASKKVHGEPRAGDSERMVIVDGVDSIDASLADTDFLGHGYVFKNSILLDIDTLFRQRTPPQQRDKLKPQQTGSLLYWMLAP